MMNDRQQMGRWSARFFFFFCNSFFQCLLQIHGYFVQRFDQDLGWWFDPSAIPLFYSSGIIAIVNTANCFLIFSSQISQKLLHVVKSIFVSVHVKKSTFISILTIQPELYVIETIPSPKRMSDSSPQAQHTHNPSLKLKRIR